MIQDLILGWFSSLLVGTLLGATTGLVLVLLAFFGLARLGCWRHPRLHGGWRITVLCLLGLLFAAIGGLSGATWGFCRAAEKKILAIDIVEAPFLREKMEPLSAVAGQFIGSALIASQRWQFCIVLLALLLLPLLVFYILRTRIAPKMPDAAEM